MSRIFKRSLIALTCVILTGICFSEKAFAGDSQDRSERRGLVVGFDVGGGGIHFAGENVGAMFGGFLIGGGLNERILLLAENVGVIGFSSNTVSGYTLLFAPQFFVFDSAFVRPGVGFGAARADLGNGVSVSTGPGFAAGLAAGYEFRLTRRFAISPEAKIGYLRADGSNHYAYGVVADLRWYF